MLFGAVSKPNELRGKHFIPAVGLEIMLTQNSMSEWNTARCSKRKKALGIMVSHEDLHGNGGRFMAFSYG
jgi:hypothetical protein